MTLFVVCENGGILYPTEIELIQELTHPRNEVSGVKHPMEIFSMILGYLKYVQVVIK